MIRLLPLSLLLFAASVAAQPAQTLTMDRIMADPDWIGPPVEQAWWAWNGQRAYYSLKREGSSVRDTWAQDLDGGDASRIDGAARADLDGLQPVYDASRARAAFVRDGNVFVRDLRSGALTQLSRDDERAASPLWGSDGALVWRVGNDRWFRWTPREGVTAAAVLKAEDDPGEAPAADALRERQLRLVETLRTERERREAQRLQERDWRRADPTRAPAPVYLGKDVEIAASALSPDGRWLLVATEAKGADKGTEGRMPKYITESGYEEFEDVRTRVGRNDPLPQAFWLVDMNSGEPRRLDLDALPGIDRDPLAELRRTAGKEPLKGARPVRIEADGPAAMQWSGDSRGAALMLHAVDNKDRWLVTLDPADGALRTRHRLTDEAWINWGFNEFGWMPDNRTLWFLSEHTGYSHLYLDAGGRTRALTSGEWEVSAPALAADGGGFLFVCNRARPGDYEVCAVPAGGGQVRELTALDGVEDFTQSPDGGRLLVRHSEAYLPPQLAVIGTDGSGLRTLTDTRSEEFRGYDWLQPQTVQVPSRHGAGTIWGKYYGPATLEPGREYPVVLFVHGAGYLQNVSERYPNYFREQMFHNLLVQNGYIVLDLDFRASEGYGRDWRTAIYRRMGHPELEDYLDGVEWLVAEKQADRDRVGIYGGSYGGFMTFMALFREPGTFKAGAALRPVTDWTQYNHAYTANILNTPELDPEAYRVSSPIEYAEGLQDHLLIAHGMIDDNVFYRDSVLLAQRLIELRKDNWELAAYPLERHAFQHSDSWYDEYRRIFELFERALKE
ncbi:prolyl oligopeptidase family serine peptidase [Luteimonas sp. RD2P54]|uniref:Prolyl oligopeptidase family serine peptidase n=1 Tax=Luteimonas endophytica TaxID=3042023 RepID=A0ABT6JD28_9GAMM|nr:prolyl oligopeptidase family serine peptidase [Luteimonas endophytica]MDH5824527.1 prolyl oligopeptidase family serine peptidase [Luteimonas endophytica]